MRLATQVGGNQVLVDVLSERIFQCAGVSKGLESGKAAITTTSC